MIYRGYEYDPEVIEDEDTRRYFHEAIDKNGGRTQIGADQSHWYLLSEKQFHECIDKLLDS